VDALECMAMKVVIQVSIVVAIVGVVIIIHVDIAIQDVGDLLLYLTRFENEKYF
jgi:hypothetical protein